MGAFSEPSEAPEQRFWQKTLIFLLYRAIPEQIKETKNGGKFKYHELMNQIKSFC